MKKALIDFFTKTYKFIKSHITLMCIIIGIVAVSVAVSIILPKQYNKQDKEYDNTSSYNESKAESKNDTVAQSFTQPVYMTADRINALEWNYKDFKKEINNFIKENNPDFYNGSLSDNTYTGHCYLDRTENNSKWNLLGYSYYDNYPLGEVIMKINSQGEEKSYGGLTLSYRIACKNKGHAKLFLKGDVERLIAFMQTDKSSCDVHPQNEKTTKLSNIENIDKLYNDAVNGKYKRVDFSFYKNSDATHLQVFFDEVDGIFYYNIFLYIQ